MLRSASPISLSLLVLTLSMALSLASVNPCDARPLTIAVLGDSLAAGYGLPASEAFPAQLERALRKEGVTATVVNAGVSGDTTAGGLARLEWVLAGRPDLVIVELGANDALRALDPARAETNLDAILTRLKKEGVRVLLAGMRAPRNLGADYARRFDPLFSRLARRHGVPLYPFFLEGVAGIPALNQDDGIHPNARGVAEIVRRILPQVRALAEKAPRAAAEPARGSGR